MSPRTALRRLDAEIVHRGLARSRDQAAELLRTGRVEVAGFPEVKPATRVTPEVSIRVSLAVDDGYVSRGAHKLVGALAAFTGSGLVVLGRRCLDAGASTGGFTDVLLRAGARQVVAVDVGYGQLAWSLRNDPRVVVRERTHVRDLDPERIDGPVELVVADLSFISLTHVLPALVRCAEPGADLVLLVKPQFEVGRRRLGKGGVVRDLAARADAVRAVASSAAVLGWGVADVVASPLPGPAGNVEYFLWLRQGFPDLAEDLLARAISQGPA
ncbi:MAG: TlyA family RNA methyltransferase [Actinomycetes bacterium]